ncbi:MAG: metallophosphoesterase family protein [Promethearchaeota archaeon]
MRETTILHLTDIEGFVPIIEENLLNKIDLVLISGDISIGSKSIKFFLKSINKIRNAFPKQIPIYYVPGNREYENMAYEIENLPLNMFPLHKKKLYYKIDSQKGIWLIGYGGALPGIFNNFVFTENQALKDLFPIFKSVFHKKKNNDYVILVAHNPPYKTLLDQAISQKNVGSRVIRKLIEDFQPDICVCGHIHESAAIQNIKKTICINPGATRDKNAGLITISAKITADIIKINIKR